jgi:hypothetical protein
MISEDDAAEALQPIVPDLVACITEAWRRYTKEVRDRLGMPSARGLANVMHELIVDEARRRFQERKGIRLHDKPDRFLLVLPQNWLVARFKKVNPALETVNIRTPTSIAFDNQIPLDFIPNGIRLTIGYQLDVFKTEVIGIYAICRQGSHLHFAIPLFGNSRPPIQMQLGQQQDSSGTKRRVSVKKPGRGSAKKKMDKND